MNNTLPDWQITIELCKNHPTLPSSLLCFPLQGRHVKTGQLAAIKVMDVTEVSENSAYTCLSRHWAGSHSNLCQIFARWNNQPGDADSPVGFTAEEESTNKWQLIKLELLTKISRLCSLHVNSVDFAHCSTLIWCFCLPPLMLKHWWMKSHASWCHDLWMHQLFNVQIEVDGKVSYFFCPCKSLFFFLLHDDFTVAALWQDCWNL